VFYGSSIDNAASDNGKPYSELPNAFRYRNELVSGCTCNGKDQVGLAPVKIEKDPTLRKGDIVAGENGLLVPAGDSDALAGALALLVEDEPLRERLGAAALERARDFTPEIVMPKLDRLYRETVADFHGTGR